MRNVKSLIVMFVCLAVTGVLSACGGTGGGDELPVTSQSPATPVTQGDPVAGELTYNEDCASCHILQPSDPQGFAPDLAGKGDVIQIKMQANHQGIALDTTQLENVIAFANQGQVEQPGTQPTPEPAPTPEPNPEPAPNPTPVPVDGKTVYDADCAACHKLGSYDTNGSPDLAGKGSLVTGKIGGGHMGITLSAEELTALIGWVDQNTSAPAPAPAPTPEPAPAPAPAPEPTPTPAPTPVDGKALYDGNCAACHKLGTYDGTGSPELAGKGSLVPGKIGAGHMGISLTTEQLNGLVDWIDQNSQASAPAPAPTPTPTPEPAPAPAPTPAPECGSCHALPPADNAHAVHQALPGVGTNCAVCHTSASAATHMDGWVDLALATTYNAKTGTAGENPDGTASCVSVSCHGGQTTPDWGTGSISVNTDCVSCHTRGTGEYNSYNSGQHGRSPHTREACTACHNTTALAVNHFSRLDTPTMEGPAATTVGGGSTRVTSYDPATGTCATSCHGNERW